MFPAGDQLAICFADVAYWLHERFSALDAGTGSFPLGDLAASERERV